MRYHASSLSKHGFNVTFVGFVGKSVPDHTFIGTLTERRTERTVKQSSKTNIRRTQQTGSASICASNVGDLSLNTVFTETKPPEDLLKDDKIKIVAITEVKGVPGNCTSFVKVKTALMARLSCTYVDDSGALFTIQEFCPCA